VDEIRNAWAAGERRLFSTSMQALAAALVASERGDDLARFVGTFRLSQEWPVEAMKRTCPEDMALPHWVALAVVVLASERTISAGRNDTWRLRHAAERYLNRLWAMGTRQSGNGDADEGGLPVHESKPAEGRRGSVEPPPVAQVPEPDQPEEPDDEAPGGPTFH
jgi:hypothetical protein